MRNRLYHRILEAKSNDEWSREIEKLITTEENTKLRKEWKAFAGRPQAAGKFTRDIIIPVWNEWHDRKHGGVNFRITQVLTGHGVFNYFLHKINKIDSNACQHCDGGNIDIVVHTIKECPAWKLEREELIKELKLRNNEELNLRSLTDRMLSSSEEWQSINKYVNKIIEGKEEAERKRQGSLRNSSNNVN